MDSFMRDLIGQPPHPSICPNCALQTVPEKPFCVRCNWDLRYSLSTLRCVYCQLDAPLTKEHIFGKWLNEEFPHEARKGYRTLLRPAKHGLEGEHPIHTKQLRIHARPYDPTVFNVCAKCNGGWMSDLHNQAKPLVKKLARGLWPKLTESQRGLLARWASMVTINLDFLSALHVIKQHQRDQLMNGNVPFTWQISIGLLSSNDQAGHHDTRTTPVPIAVGDEAMTLTSTYFCIENACFHIYSSECVPMALYGPGLSEKKLVLEKIWPEYEESIVASQKVIEKFDMISIQTAVAYPNHF